MPSFKKNMKPILLVLSILTITTEALSQKSSARFKVCIAAFYNLENFFDTTDNPMIHDDDFTINGIKHYDQFIYQNKIENLARVISEIGKDISVDGPVILGVAEIENDTVLNELIRHPLLRKRAYQLIHYDSKDIRGIDVALLYNPRYLTVLEAGTKHVQLPGYEITKFETRDILWVKGLLDQETVYILVNHWPSKRGGEDKSMASRASAAAACRSVINSILFKEPDAKIIVMGDLNDNPDSYSVTKVLQSSGNIRQLKKGNSLTHGHPYIQKAMGLWPIRIAGHCLIRSCFRRLGSQRSKGLLLS